MTTTTITVTVAPATTGLIIDALLDMEHVSGGTGRYQHLRWDVRPDGTLREFWDGIVVQNTALTGIVVLRTVYDYYSVWSFYYPQEQGREQIPAPRPARPPARGLR